ncbi:MAG TPA: VCBS repeat-containing protein [Phycisphaerae bacterium]|jgi:hypothetical protein
MSACSNLFRSASFRLLAVNALLLGIGAAGAQAQFSFGPAASIAIAIRPDGVAAGDFDRDSDLDLAVSAENPDRVVILTNTGGVLAVTASYPVGADVGVGFIAAADLDGDTDADLAVALQNTNTVIILLNQGNGTFVLGASTSVGSNPKHIAVGDFDGDVDLDLAVANRDSNNVTILRNNGNATFTTATVNVGVEPRAVAAGNFDGDGDLDLVVSNHGSRTLSIMTNAGTGTFTLTGTLFVPATVRPDGVVTGDFDADGDIDIATATSDPAFNFATIFLNNGAGSFSGPFNYPVGALNPGSIVAADFDCDGDLDLATGNEDSGNVSVLPNNGSAMFGAALLLATGAHPDTVAAADLDGDGLADLAVTNRDSDTVSILINNTVPSCGAAVPVDIVSANPPASSPYVPGQPFRDVLQNTSVSLLPQGIGAAGTPSEGGVVYATISVTFSGAPSPSPSAANITLPCTDVAGNGQGDCPMVTGVSGSGAGPWQISLSGVIPARECVTFTFAGTTAGQRLQYQSLPGDTNLDGTSSTQDLLFLVQRINDGTANQPDNLARFNIDRSALQPPHVNTQDLLRLVQLLNGVNASQVFNGATVAACP